MVSSSRSFRVLRAIFADLNLNGVFLFFSDDVTRIVGGMCFFSSCYFSDDLTGSCLNSFA